MAQVLEITQTPTITASSAYTTGNALGGLLTFADATRWGSAFLRTVVVLDRSNQKSAVDLLLFNQTLASTQTDKTAIAIGAADSLNCIGSISLVTGDYVSISSSIAVATKNGLIYPLVAGGSQNNLYGQLVVRGTPTYTASSAIQIKLVFERAM
jgi:hypothetical protein